MNRGRELALVQMNFSVAFVRLNNYGLLFKLHDVEICDVVRDVKVVFKVTEYGVLWLMVCRVRILRCFSVFLKIASFSVFAARE